MLVSALHNKKHRVTTIHSTFCPSCQGRTTKDGTWQHRVEEKEALEVNKQLGYKLKHHTCT